MATDSNGLYYMRARYYNPDIKRFINQDIKVGDIGSSQKSADLESGRCAKGDGIGCFIAGTKVKTVNGEKNIEDVESGDYVLAENPETVEHPFYVEGIGFVSAGELRAGDIVRTSDGKNLPVDKVELEPLEEPVLVYNFEVEDFHTYYVSGLGVLVHNDCLGGSGSSSGKYQIGAYKDIKGVEGLDAHRVGQKAVMKKLVANYDPKTAPAINVPKEGHTISGPNGIVSRNIKGITSARQLLARDLFELKRVYSDIPNSALRELIDMNKKMYPEMRK